MRLLVALASFLFCGSAIAQTDTLSRLLNQGIALHDKGEYEAAIKIYDQIISLDSTYPASYYEKSFSLFSGAKYQECINTCQYFLVRFPGNAVTKDIFSNYGSALDALGKSTDAIAMYTEGILKFPESYMLYYNRGITEYHLKQFSSATNDFKNAVSLNPFHASSHQSLAYCLYENNKVAAMLSLTVFLMLEPEGNRAAKNLKLLNQLMGSGVSKKEDKNISVNFTAGELESSVDATDNFQMHAMMIRMQSALEFDEKNKNLPVAEKLKNKMEFLGDPELLKPGAKGFFTEFYIPFLYQLKKDNQLLTACHIINATAEDAVNQQWLTDNQQAVKSFYDWLKDYKWIEF